MYYTSLLWQWHHVMILIRTDHPYLREGRHTTCQASCRRRLLTALRERLGPPLLRPSDSPMPHSHPPSTVVAPCAIRRGPMHHCLVRSPPAASNSHPSTTGPDAASHHSVRLHPPMPPSGSASSTNATARSGSLHQRNRPRPVSLGRRHPPLSATGSLHHMHIVMFLSLLQYWCISSMPDVRPR
jgi:hypothetical protein